MFQKCAKRNIYKYIGCESKPLFSQASCSFGGGGLKPVAIDGECVVYGGNLSQSTANVLFLLSSRRGMSVRVKKVVL